MGLTRDGSLFYTLFSQSAEIYTAELNAAGRIGSSPAALAGRYVGANTMPDYSPDGRFLAYFAGPLDSPSSAIRIRSIDTGVEREISKPFPDVRQLRWYPDGKALLIFGRDMGTAGPGFYRIDAQTGTKSVVLAEGVARSAAANPTFSPDGKYLYYESPATEPASPALMRLDVASGQKQEVFRPNSGYLRLYALSPDGSQIVFNWRKESDLLYVLPATGGEPKLLYEYPKNEYSRAWGGIGWVPDGKAVFYHHGMGGQDELLRIPLSGGGAEKLLTTGVIRRIAVNPDARQVAWEARTQSTEFFIMENLFPRPRVSR
jgi:Tol biopolymer transport system component